ncbi:MAG: universal stress protein [Deltaproteobacteria bacterium]|nr:universal stress protein [Deltaproteobacteria bacterium]
MERILVGMNPASASFWAGLHALSLAKRIDARVCFLYVVDPRSEDHVQHTYQDIRSDAKKTVERFVEKARAEGIAVDYYVSEGDYESELIRFIQEKRITMLVLGAPGGHAVAPARFTSFLDRIRHRVDCRIEVVHEKSFTGNKKRKEDGNVAHVSTHRGQ